MMSSRRATQSRTTGLASGYRTGIEHLEARQLLSTTIAPVVGAGTGTISGALFADFNGNGSWDTGEGRNAGWTVYIDANNNGVLNKGEKRSITNINGLFSLESLLPGTYVVREVVAEGWYRTVPASSDSHTVVVTANGTTTVNFGNAPLPGTLGRISGTLWADMNNNASLDSGDLRNVGWTAYIDANNNAVLDAGEKSTITNINGNFSFEHLAPGTYTVRQVLQAGWQRTVPTTTDRWIVNVVGGQTSSVNFGNAPLPGTLGRITGTIWSDLNENNTWDAGDGRLTGWTVFLDLNGNSNRDATEPVATTDVSGNFSFNSILPGSFIVRQQLEPGWGQVSPSGSGAHSITVGVGQTVAVAFGNVALAAGFGAVSGTLWADLNHSGGWDSGDGRLAGWRVYVDANDNAAFDAGELFAFTNSTGGYTISNVPSGALRTIRQVMQPGWRGVSPAAGRWIVNVLTNQTASASFGNEPIPGAAQVRGSLFSDDNANGSWDTGDGRNVGWTVYLDSNDNAVLDAGEISTITDQNGAFLFPGLASGNYILRQIVQPGFRQTVPRDSDHYAFTLVTGQIGEGNFGNTRAVSAVSGLAFHDLNSNNFRDAGEPPLANWAVYFDDNNNAENDHGERWTTTDSAGNFSFTGLPAGTYRVRLINRFGWTPTLGAQSAIAVVNGTNSVGNFGFAARQNPEPATYGAEKLVSWLLIGGSSTNVADRSVGWNIKTHGWSGFVATHVQPQLNAGVRRIMLHNPFGSLPGQDFQADQYLAAQQAGLNWLTQGFAAAWAPVTAQGIEVIAYMGAPANDSDFAGLAPAAWWARFWASFSPVLDAGMNIAMDKSLAANPGSIDWDAVLAVRSQGRQVYGEPRAPSAALHWRSSPLIAEDYIWKDTDPELHPEEIGWAAKDPQITGEVVRIFTRPPAGQTWATQSQWIRSYARSVFREGHTVAVNLSGMISQGIPLSTILS